MNTDTGDDKFEKRVLAEYEMYSSFKKAEEFDSEELSRHFKGSRFGCLFAPFLRFFLRPLSEAALKKEQAKQGYPALEAAARKIVANDNVKNAICSALRELPKYEIVTEEVFIRIIARVLNEQSQQREIDISKDPKLFSVVGFQIFSTGVNAYCGGPAERV